MNQALLIAHIAVLGYWLGSELVINATYRFVCKRDDLPFAARDAMMEQVMHCDQHVRYALLLQLTLGTMLAVQTGLGPPTLVWLAPCLGIAWLGLVEASHRMRQSAMGARLAAFDRGLRFLLLVGLVAAASTLDWPLWLRLKLLAFAGIVACGVAIRFKLIAHFQTWATMRSDGATEQANAAIKAIYSQATAILGLLWFCIAAILCLSVAKPF